MTARTLETLIRLSTAHAKARLPPRIQQKDALAAEEILQFALFKEVLKRPRRKKRKLNNGAAVDKTVDDEEEESDEVSDRDGDVPDQAPTIQVVPTAKQPQAEKEKNSILEDGTQDGTQDAMRVDESQDIIIANAVVNPERYA